jgi:hypothetical protein
VNFTRPKLTLRSLFVPIIVGLFFIGGPIIGLLTDARWFESLGAGDLFWQRLQIQGALFAGEHPCVADLPPPDDLGRVRDCTTRWRNAK